MKGISFVVTQTDETLHLLEQWERSDLPAVVHHQSLVAFHAILENAGLFAFRIPEESLTGVAKWWQFDDGGNLIPGSSADLWYSCDRDIFIAHVRAAIAHLRSIGRAT